MSHVNCPHCGAKITPGESGYVHDGDLNILCAACGCPVMPATAEAEAEITPVFRRPQNRAQHVGYPHHRHHVGGYLGSDDVSDD